MNTHQNKKTASSLVSIIMPAYNAEAYIEDAIKSVLSQTYLNWELIIADDGSTDNTRQLIQRFTDKRIIYQHFPHTGSNTLVRNRAIALSKGEFIAFLDADDLFERDALEKFLEPLQANPGLSCVYGFYRDVDENGKVINNVHPLLTSDKKGGWIVSPRADYTWENILGNGWPICISGGLMLRRSTWERVGEFNAKLKAHGDFEYMVRLFFDNPIGIYSLPYHVFRYRLHSQSVTKDPSRYKKIIQAYEQVLHWLFEELPIPDELKKLKSKRYAYSYRYLAQVRLKAKQPEIVRDILFLAISHQNIRLWDWLTICLTILLRSYLPSSVNQFVFKLKSYFKLLSEYTLFEDQRKLPYAGLKWKRSL